MTEKLFYQDSHLKEFEAIVLACEAVGEVYHIILNQTVFFPEGGGQNGDTGYLNGIEVIDTKERSDEVLHIVKQPLKVGTKVIGELLFGERFSKMQQHTGEHIISGLIHQRFGFDNVGFHLGSDQVTMDFNGILSAEELKEVEYQANVVVSSNLLIQVSYPSKDTLSTLEYRSKIEIEGQVRIVTIEGIDVCACCAPHVANTGEIGIVKIVDAIKYKGGTRVSMLCGFRALLDYRTKEESVKEISALLSAKPERISEAVVRQGKEIQLLKEKSVKYQNLYVEGKLPLVHVKNTNITLFEEELEGNAVRRFVNEGMKMTSGICGCFVGDDAVGYSYILGSESVDVRTYAARWNDILQGKGGGKPQMIQGFVKGTKEQIISELEK